MASYTISPIWGAGAQLFDNSGNVLTGGKIYTYFAGTSTPAETYTTPIGNVANSNPIVANAAGRLTNEIWLPISSSYKFVLKDANDVLIATYDNIPTLPQPAIINDASSISYEQGYTVTAGAFTVGSTYLITSVGNTDFTAIGATANITGIHFTATGVGSGTGTAKYTRTVQAKLQESVSVKDFGAVGNGVTDDAPAILRAAQYIDSLGGGTVYFPAPDIAYAMNPTAFNNLSNVAFVGNGAKIIALQPANTPYGTFSMGNCSHLEFSGLDIDGRYPYWLTQPQGPQLNWNNFNITLFDCTYVNIHGCFLHDSGVNRAPFDKFGDGIYISGTNSTTCNNITITNNIFKDDGRWSVAVLCGSHINISNNIATRSNLNTPSIGFIDFEYNPGTGIGTNIIVANNSCNGACEIVSSHNINPGFTNMSITDNVLNGLYSDGTQRPASGYTWGIGAADVSNLMISNNSIIAVASDNIHVEGCYHAIIDGNVLTPDTLFPSSCVYISGLDQTTISNNNIYNNNASGFGIQANGCTSVSLIGNSVSNLPNWAITLNGTSNNKIINNNMLGNIGSVCSFGGGPMVIMGNTANSSGRLDVQAHTIIGNQMGFNTIYGNWWEGGGRYTIPDAIYSRSVIWFAAAPTTGTWAVGDIVKNSTPSVGNPKGWVCTVAGTPGTWVSEGNL